MECTVTFCPNAGAERERAVWFDFLQLGEYKDSWYRISFLASPIASLQHHIPNRIVSNTSNYIFELSLSQTPNVEISSERRLKSPLVHHSSNPIHAKTSCSDAPRSDIHNFPILHQHSASASTPKPSHLQLFPLPVSSAAKTNILRALLG